MNEWISVKDGLPKNECIAFGYQSEMMIGYLVVQCQAVEDFECECEYECEDDNGALLEDVTHWMKLPEPPK